MNPLPSLTCAASPAGTLVDGGERVSIPGTSEVGGHVRPCVAVICADTRVSTTLEVWLTLRDAVSATDDSFSAASLSVNHMPE